MATPRNLPYQAGRAMQRDLSKSATKILASGAADPGGHIKKLKRIFSLSATAPLRTAAHEDVAKAMASAVQDEVAAISARSTSAPRKGRLSGGLSRAVNAPSFTEGNKNGIYFIDRDIMNRYARHWQRLNFGTGARQEAAMVAKPRFNGRQLLDATVKPISVGGGQVLANPMIPNGFFNHNGNWKPRASEYRGLSTGRAFSVKDTTDWRETSPIRATRYIDAGLQAFESELPLAYDTMIRVFGQMAKGGRSVKNVQA